MVGEKGRLLEKVGALTTDSNVCVGIGSQIKLAPKENLKNRRFAN